MEIATRQGGAKLILLNGFEVVAQILDTLPNSRFVVLFHVLEDRSPYRHFGRSMRGETKAEAKNVCDIFLRECSSVPLRQSREVGRRFPKGPRHGPVTSTL